MRINPIKFNNYNFKSSDRQVKIKDDGSVITRESSKFRDPDSTLLYSNYTNFFRNDLNVSRNATLVPSTWHGFRRLIAKEFKDAPKVNVYDFGCSDGSEAYSFALSMIEEVGDKYAQKFFPIVAFDIDDSVLNIAKSGEIPCDYNDLQKISRNIKDKKHQKMFEIDFSDSSEYPLKFSPNEELSSKVIFHKSSIEDEIDNINPSNSLVMCRNFWPYFQDSMKRVETLQRLCQKLDSTSRIIIGNYDKFAIAQLLEEFGYQEVVPLVYKKSSN